ncbi:MAG: hypothetical protein WDZ85_00530 [Candidatus Paceibacterota bacterium]
MNEENTSVGMSPANKPPDTPILNEGNKHTAMAVLAYIGPLVIIPYLTARDSSFVKFHIKQGLVLLSLWIVIWVLSMFMWRLSLLIQLLNLITLILAILGIVNVLQGRERELPIIGAWAKHFSI